MSRAASDPVVVPDCWVAPRSDATLASASVPAATSTLELETRELTDALALTVTVIPPWKILASSLGPGTPGWLF